MSAFERVNRAIQRLCNGYSSLPGLLEWGRSIAARVESGNDSACHRDGERSTGGGPHVQHADHGPPTNIGEEYGQRACATAVPSQRRRFVTPNTEVKEHTGPGHNQRLRFLTSPRSSAIVKHPVSRRTVSQSVGLQDASPYSFRGSGCTSVQSVPYTKKEGRDPREVVGDRRELDCAKDNIDRRSCGRIAGGILCESESDKLHAVGSLWGGERCSVVDANETACLDLLPGTGGCSVRSLLREEMDFRRKNADLYRCDGVSCKHLPC